MIGHNDVGCRLVGYRLCLNGVGYWLFITDKIKQIAINQ
ncbi:hypothetical protein [Providencia phage PSTRCR_120]|uniref:Uncharacterized protein n=1 Tax=Providencia phage PSTRCR_120 TaxID=2800826 RepID=A0A7T7CL26_9CAUD|nr:hypothetical protein [Providencia phage PSTRCR_120]